MIGSKIFLLQPEDMDGLRSINGHFGVVFGAWMFNLAGL